MPDLERLNYMIGKCTDTVFWPARIRNNGAIGTRLVCADIGVPRKAKMTQRAEEAKVSVKDGPTI